LIGYVYYFENINKEIIYVGQTKDIETRIKTHFGGSGHLNKECYNETCNVYYSELQSINEAKMYEIYYIAKFKPKYNTANLNDGDISISLPPINFTKYNLHKCTETLNDQLIEDIRHMIANEITQHLNTIKESIQTIKTCCHYDISVFTKKFRHSKTDRELFETHNHVLHYNSEHILNSISKIENTLNIN